MMSIISFWVTYQKEENFQPKSLPFQIPQKQRFHFDKETGESNCYSPANGYKVTSNFWGVSPNCLKRKCNRFWEFQPERWQPPIVPHAHPLNLLIMYCYCMQCLPRSMYLWFKKMVLFTQNSQTFQVICFVFVNFFKIFKKHPSDLQENDCDN